MKLYFSIVFGSEFERKQFFRKFEKYKLISLNIDILMGLIISTLLFVSYEVSLSKYHKAYLMGEVVADLTLTSVRAGVKCQYFEF